MDLHVLVLIIALSLQLGITHVAGLTAQSSSQDREITTVKQKAEGGNADAQVSLGLAYATGDGVAQDEPEAVKWFRKAADQGNAAGEYLLGEVFATGRGVAVNYEEADKWLMKAANHGDARAQYNLAAMYTQGLGVSKDDAEAAKWMGKAADQGLAAGQFGLGSMYANGKGVPQSDAESEKWYRKAADQNDPDALNNLAYLLATSADPKVRKPQEAIATAQKAIEIDVENPGYLDTLATTYYEAGQYGKAAENEQKALAISPDKASYKKALDKYLAAVNQH